MKSFAQKRINYCSVEVLSMNEQDTLVNSTAAQLPKWAGPLLLVSALALGYGAFERGYEWSQTGGIVRGFSSVGFAMLALFNITVALRLIRRAI